MPLSFNIANPDALWLLLLLPVIVLLARAGTALRKGTRGLSVAVRLLIVVLLILSIANLQLVTASDKLATVFLLDTSDSVGADGKEKALDFTRKALLTMKDNQQAGVIVFGQDALVEKLVNRDKTIPNVESKPVTSYSNLAEAVRLGTALLPNDAQRRLILISDGNQNVDEVRNAAKIASSNGVQIDTVAISRQNGPEVSIGNVQVPNNLRQGEEFAVKVAVDSNYAGPAQLLILQDGKVISDRAVELKTGSNLFSEQLVAKSKGFVNYTARIITPKDTVQQNNETNSYSLVKGGPRALLVEGHPEQKEAANLQAALSKAGIEATTITPEKFPSLNELTQYDTVMLVNVPGNTLTAANMNVLQAYVKDLGKGMVMVGGEESYGLGGYFRTPVEDMLPVELQLPSKLQTPSVAMVLVIDRSGSMAESYNGPGAGTAGIAKIELAKDAAYLATTQLSNNDQVGVVVFDTQAQWQIPLAPMGNPSNLVSQIGRIAPGGGTYVYSGFKPAIEALEKVSAKNKHIILMTDGQDSEIVSYENLINSANKANITVSTVGLGTDFNTNLLNTIAERSGGRYTFINDPANLPKIFAKEAHLAARSYIIEEPFVPAISDPSPIVKGISAMPQLKGYVATQAKSTATKALVTGRNEPLLTHWQYGLGRVAAWTSDAKGRWATNWLSWTDFPRFWSQVIRWTVAENEAGGLQVQTKTVGNRIYVTADAISLDSQYLNSLEVKANVVSSGLNGSKEDITLTQTAPGHYEGYFTPTSTGSFIVNVQGTGDKVNLTQTVGAIASYSPEYKQLGSNDLLLKEIATLTGGQFISLTTPAAAFRDDLRRVNRQEELWPWLLLLAILLFPLDIAIRRIRLSFASLAKGFRSNKPQLAVAMAGGPAIVEEPSEVDRLLDAKQRAVQRNSHENQAPPQIQVARPEQIYYQPPVQAPPQQQLTPTQTYQGPPPANPEQNPQAYSGLLRRINRNDNNSPPASGGVTYRPAPRKNEPPPANMTERLLRAKQRANDERNNKP